MDVSGLLTSYVVTSTKDFCFAQYGLLGYEQLNLHIRTSIKILIKPSKLHNLQPINVKSENRVDIVWFFLMII